MTPEQVLDLAHATLHAAQFCFLITRDEVGQSTARLMQPFAPEPDLTLWLGTSPHSRKVREIQRDARVTLGFAHIPDGAYVTLSGSAMLEADVVQRQRYWRETFAAFWPAGPTDDDYSLIKFVPTRIEIMHIAREVAPAPFGLRPVILHRTGSAWVIDEA
ncbi:MAG TPA: pyridoxamine 5'-phosphate oxidase family protein [Candidatus Tectomicrobia bacterium]